MTRIFPRSPYQRLAGYVHLPRLIDKARLHRKGLLVGYNYKTLGFDKHLLAFLNVDPETFEQMANTLESDEEIVLWLEKSAQRHTAPEIEHWNELMQARFPDTPEKMARFRFFLKEAGGEARADVKTYFDLIELDEGRL